MKCTQEPDAVHPAQGRAASAWGCSRSSLWRKLGSGALRAEVDMQWPGRNTVSRRHQILSGISDLPWHHVQRRTGPLWPSAPRKSLSTNLLTHPCHPLTSLHSPQSSRLCIRLLVHCLRGTTVWSLLLTAASVQPEVGLARETSIDSYCISEWKVGLPQPVFPGKGVDHIPFFAIGLRIYIF